MHGYSAEFHIGFIRLQRSRIYLHLSVATSQAIEVMVEFAEEAGGQLS